MCSLQPAILALFCKKKKKIAAFVSVFGNIFSGNLVLLLWMDIPELSACVEPMNISLHLLHMITYTMISE